MLFILGSRRVTALDMKLSMRNRGTVELRKPKPAIVITVTSGVISYYRIREIRICLTVVSTPLF
jgi:hypothetical protein